MYKDKNRRIKDLLETALGAGAGAGAGLLIGALPEIGNDLAASFRGEESSSDGSTINPVMVGLGGLAGGGYALMLANQRRGLIDSINQSRVRQGKTPL